MFMVENGHLQLLQLWDYRKNREIKNDSQRSVADEYIYQKLTNDNSISGPYLEERESELSLNSICILIMWLPPRRSHLEGIAFLKNSENYANGYMLPEGSSMLDRSMGKKQNKYFHIVGVETPTIYHSVVK